MRKLFSRDLLDRPLFSAIIIVSVIFAVVLMYCVISYSAVIVDIEVGYAQANCGDAEIMISSNTLSGGSLVPTSPLNDKDGVESYTGVLELNVSYTKADGDYGSLFLRGFEPSQIEDLQPIKYIAKVFENTEDITVDQVIISYAFAQKNNLKLNSPLSVIVNGKTRTLYVAAVADDRGYFYGNNDAAITTNTFVATQYGFNQGHIYNKVYVNAVDGLKDEVFESLSVLSAYKDFEVEYSNNQGSTDAITKSYVIGFGICSIAMVIAAMLIVYKVFDVQFKTKSLVISRLKIIGAKSSRIASLFFAETSVFCIIGVLIGCGVAVLANKLIVEGTTDITPVVNGGNLAIAAATVFAMAILTAARPIILSSRQSIKECMTESKVTEYKLNGKLLVAVLSLLVLSIILEFTLKTSMARAYAAFCGLISTIALAVIVIPFVFRLTGNLLARRKGRFTTLAANNYKHNRNNISSLQIMMVGVLFCLLSTAMMNGFNSYVNGLIDNSANVVCVYNVADMSDEILAEFSAVEGVQSVTPSYDTASGGVTIGDYHDVNIHALSSCERLCDLFNFSGTTEEIARYNSILNDKSADYVLITDGYAKLKGMKIGDELDISYKGITHTYTIGAFITTTGSSSRFIVDIERFAEYYDTVDYNVLYIKTDNTAAVSDRLRAEFVEEKIEVIPLQAVILQRTQRNLISARFVSVVTTFIAIIVAAAVACNIIIGEMHGGRENEQLLLIGCTNGMLMRRTLFVNGLTGIIFTALILAFSALAMLTLSDAAVIADAYMRYEFFAKDIFTYVAIFVALNFITVPLFRLLQPYKIKVSRVKTL